MPDELKIHPAATACAEGIAIGIVTLFAQAKGSTPDLVEIVHTIAERIERGLNVQGLFTDKAVLDWLDQRPKPMTVQGGVDDGSEAIFWGIAAKTGTIRQAVLNAYLAEQAALKAQQEAAGQQPSPDGGQA